MPKRKVNNKAAYLIAALLVVGAVLLVRSLAISGSVSDFSKNTIELDTIDLKYEPNPNLYFANGCEGIRMGVTADQAFSIREALVGEAFARPLTHDLSYEALNAFNIRLLYAKIDSIKDGIYTAKLLFSDGSSVHKADARPSDAAAYTLRYGNSIAISKEIASNMTDVC